MVAGNWIVFDTFKKWKGDGTFDLDANSFKITLHTNSYVPSLAHSVYADLTNELSTANGYTNGGQALTGVTWTQAGSVTTFDSDDPVWNASGGSIGPCRIAVIRAVGTLNGHVDPLVAYCVLDTVDVTVTTGNPLTIQQPVDGIFRESGAAS